MRYLGLIGNGNKTHIIIEYSTDRGNLTYSECGASGVFRQLSSSIIKMDYDESKVTCSRCLKILKLNKKDL